MVSRWRSGHRRTLRRTAAGAAAVLLGALGMSVGVSAGAPGQGAKATQIKAVFHFYGVACPSVGACVAVGQSNGLPEAVFVPVSGGVPGRVVRLRSAFSFSGAACPRAGHCVVVGQSQTRTTAVLASIINGRLRQVHTLPRTFLFGIDCGTPNSCWATGENSAYSHALVAHVVNGSVQRVFKLAGVFPGAFHHDTSIPITAGAPAGSPPACWSSSSCLAVGATGGRDAGGLGKSDRAGLIVELNNGVAHATTLTGTGRLVGVACRSSASCIAVGDPPGPFRFFHTSPDRLVTITNARPTSIVPTEVGGIQYAGSGLTGISCPTTSLCYATAAGPVIETIAGGQLTRVQDISNSLELSAISCTPIACLGAGGASQRVGEAVGALYYFTAP